MHQDTLTIHTSGRGLTNITPRIAGVVEESGVHSGLAHLFIQHTSASLIIQENADPDVQIDLESFFQRLVPDDDPIYRHTDEGPDDMSAHVRSVLTATTLSVPIQEHRLGLGTWQSIYLWEHRSAPHQRRITITIHG